MAMGDPSQLPGSHRTRVFVGGSYFGASRKLLDGLGDAVRSSEFVPVVADEFTLPAPGHDIHDVTLFLLHSCRLAVFEVSTLSGALMEIERLADYGVRKSLLLYQHPGRRQWPVYPDAWRTTQMLKSLVREQADRMKVRVYTRRSNAFNETHAFLTAIRRSAYGKLHGI